MRLSFHSPVKMPAPVIFAGNAPMSDNLGKLGIPVFSGDSVDFQGPRFKLETAEDLYHFLGGFDRPNAIRTASEVQTAEEKAAALISFLANDAGRQVRLRVKTFDERYQKIDLDGFDTSIVLTHMYEDDLESGLIPMINIEIGGVQVYSTQRQMTDEFWAVGRPGPVAEQARETAALFKRMIEPSIQ